MKMWIKFSVLIGVSIIAAYCLRQKTEFDVTIVNSGDHVLNQVTVFFEDFHFKFGYLTVSKSLVKSATFGGASTTWPRQVEVSWVEESKPDISYKKLINIRPKLRPSSIEKLELMIRVENGKVCGYPKIWTTSDGLKYRYDRDEPCQFE